MNPAKVHVGYFPGCFRYIVRPSKAGSDCPVVFLPGLGGRAEHAWDIPDRQCIAIDYPGSGESVSEWGPVSCTSIANMVWRLLDFLGVETCEIIGFSFGGSIAQKMVAQAPKRVQKVTLVNAHAGIPISGIPVTVVGFVGCIIAMWSLFSLSLAHRDMNAAWILLHGFERLTEEERRKTMKKWEPRESSTSAVACAVMWIRRRIGDVFLAFAYITHHLRAQDVAILREFGASKRLQIICAKDDMLVRQDTSFCMSRVFQAPLRVVPGGHMSITLPFEDVFLEK